MSKHPSLKLKDSELQQRNVLKRFERIMLILKKSKDQHLNVFNLPKYKRKRMKGLKKEVKKEEVGVKEESGEASEVEKSA